MEYSGFKTNFKRISELRNFREKYEEVRKLEASLNKQKIELNRKLAEVHLQLADILEYLREQTQEEYK